MESSSTPYRPTFATLQCRLIRILKIRLDNGEFTERGLARLSGISQPQVHNMLKGARKLSPESADVLLGALHLSVLDLLTESDFAARDLPPAHPAGSFLPSHPASQLQLQLLLDPELIPRKNPALALPSHFDVTEQAS